MLKVRRDTKRAAALVKLSLNIYCVKGNVVRLVGAGCIAGVTTFCKPVRGSSDAVPVDRCNFVSAEPLVAINSSSFDGSPTVSTDERELFFTSERNGQRDLFVSTRRSKNAAWSEPASLGEPIDDSRAGDFSLRLAPDDMALYFASNRSGGFGEADIYVARRESRHHGWGPAINLGPPVNTEAFEAFPTLSADGTVLYFNRGTTFDSQDSDIWMSTRTGPEGKWTLPKRLPDGINSQGAEFSPSRSLDGRVLYFASDRGGSIEIWVSKRAATDGDWSEPKRLGPGVNVPGAMTLAPFISTDQQALYFMSARPDPAGPPLCTPRTCFNRVDLYVARATCH